MAIDWNEPASREMRESSLLGARVLMHGLGLLLIGFGIAILLKGRPDRTDATWGGVLFLVFGISVALLAFKLPWTLAKTEEELQRDERFRRRFFAIAKGGELFFLTLALLGLVMPEPFGFLWTNHRTMTLFVMVLATYDLATWAVRRMRSRRTVE